MTRTMIAAGLMWLFLIVELCAQTTVPELLKREISREGSEYLQKLRKNTPFGSNEFNLDALRAGMGSRRLPTIKDVKLSKVKVEDVPCEWVLAPGADPDVRLLYLHGGGFVSGSGGYYLAQAAHISAAAKCAVLLPDYRLAPEHRFPAGLDDCVLAHKWMVANGPAGPGAARATFVAGDSAGGSLTLATLLALRDRKLALPVGGIALSPTTDLTLASDSLRTVSDPIISAKTMPVFRDHYLGKTDPREPLASPVFGDYRGLPPLLIQVGEHEMLRDDSIRVAKKARADGIAVQLEVWPGMFHVFQSHEPLLPEARAAIDHIAEFMRSSLPASGAAKERPLKVYVLAGTSNMLGATAKIDSLPEDLRQPLKDVLVYQKGEWAPLEAGKNLVGNEATFGQAMTKHLGEPIGIIWISVASASGKSPGAGINNMVKQSRDKGRPIVIAGILMDVSYFDGSKEENAKAYGENLTRWIEATRKEIGNDSLPIVMNRAIPPVADRPPYLDLIRKTQDSLKLPSFRVFSCDDVPRGGDKVHFNTEGRLEMGKRFAAGMIELIKVDKEGK